MPFHNPYNFIPTPDRGDQLNDFFVGDHDPSKEEFKEDHSRYWSERYTGTIPVVLRTKTPLFITDPQSKRPLDEKLYPDHFCYDTLDYIPATALKGMLSSAYEAITNSRYRVFSEKQHSRRLGMRAQANPNLVPGRVRRNGNLLEVELFTGTTGLAAGNPSPLYAAWLPMYNSPIRGFLAGLNGTWQTGVTIRQYQHDRGFRFWSVVNIAGRPVTPITTHAVQVPGVADRIVDGYVVISEKIFGRKHDERFFFNDSTTPHFAPVNDTVQKNYEALIADYQAVHEGGANPPIPPVIIHGEHITNQARKTLREGDFVYAKMNGNTIAALYPVQISRELYERSPWDCTYPSIRPADNIDNLSPADRVFGLANQKVKRAWKGRVRISDSTSVQPLTFEPIPLAILGNPKPSQVRFYLGDQNGDPQRDGIPKLDAAYSNKKKLRGRKIYLHQLQQDPNYWTPEYGLHNFAEYYKQIDPHQNETEKNRRSGQNRSISSWIPIGSEFRFTIKVENLTREELGALLTLLTQTTRNQQGEIQKERFFKLGYGKPLGFGSVTLEMDLPNAGILRVFTGGQMRSRYVDLDDATPKTEDIDDETIKNIIESYKIALIGAYGEMPKSKSKDVEIPSPWEACPKAKAIISDLFENVESFENSFWKIAFEKNDDTLLLDNDLSELLEQDGAIDELRDFYEKSLAIYRKQNKKNTQQPISIPSTYDNAWRRIPFITDFVNSLNQYENVHYPRNNSTDKGYVWFVGNEKQRQGGGIYCYSLSRIGGLLSETQ
jgi:CRISPR-associated protein (TIGR03986 family)